MPVSVVDFVPPAPALPPSLRAARLALARDAGAESAAGPRCCLLAGPERSGKSSLLLQLAYSRVAANAGQRVLYVCDRGRAEQTPPLLPPGVLPGDPALQRIDVKYATCEADLRRLFAGVHLLPAVPAAVLVDDLSALLVAGAAGMDRRGRDAALVKLLALMRDAADPPLGPNEGAGPCGFDLVVSDASGPDGPRATYLFRRWLPLVLHIRTEGHGVFSLAEHDAGGGAGHGARVFYSIGPQNLEFCGLDT